MHDPYTGPMEQVGASSIGATGQPPAATSQNSILTVGAIASLAASIIHGTAAGIQSEHQTLARIFMLLAIAQGAAAVVAFVRRDRVVGRSSGSSARHQVQRGFRIVLIHQSSRPHSPK